jgi:hypothetical protein
MDHRGIILCDGSQGIVSIDVTLTNELPILRVDPTKISHLYVETLNVWTLLGAASIPLRASVDSSLGTFQRSPGSGRYTCGTLVWS